MALTAAEATAAATAAVDNYCVGPPPPAIRTAAIEHMANWILRAPSDGLQSVSHGDQTVSWTKDAQSSGIMMSGAAALLSPWRRPRGRVIEAAS